MRHSECVRALKSKPHLTGVFDMRANFNITRGFVRVCLRKYDNVCVSVNHVVCVCGVDL